MTQSLRQIKNRIRTVESVEKVMHAMEIISATKLRVLEKRVAPARKYFFGLETMLSSLLADSQDILHPFMEAKKGSVKTALFVVGSDMGLCGSYNAGIMRATEDLMARTGRENVLLATIGKKAFNYFRKRGMSASKAYEGMRGRLPGDIPAKVLKDMEAMFLSGGAREIYLAYMHMESAARHSPVIKKVFPVEKQEAKRTEHIYEPDARGVLDKLMPAYLEAKMRLAFLEAYTAENSMRAMAMKEATTNAEDLLEALTLTRNKVRQASITKELLEIVSSAEVMR